MTALEALAHALPPGVWVTVLTAGGGRDAPRLYVASREVPGRASDVYAQAGWFWWPHATRIARMADPTMAAAMVTQALGAVTVATEPPSEPTP